MRIDAVSSARSTQSWNPSTSRRKRRSTSVSTRRAANETLPAGVKALRIIAYNLADAVKFIKRLRQETSKCKEFVHVINAGRAEAEEEGFARRASGAPCCRRKVVLMAERLDLEGAQPALCL